MKKTIEEKRKELNNMCNHCNGCDECPLYILPGDCRDFRTEYSDSDIEMMYRVAFAKSIQMDNQDIKADAGKPQLTLVPRKIIYDIAKVREYGIKKYGEKESWKRVEIQRYRDAAFRHFMAYLDDTQGIDEESGLPHLWHLACNIAFLTELEEADRKEDEV